MRKLAFAAVIAAVAPLAAMAQSQTPSQPANGSQTITRQQYVDRASTMAGKRFDAIDTNHTGTITVAQLRAFRQAHHMHHGMQAPSTQTPSTQTPSTQSPAAPSPTQNQ
jgi:hypothetical protein